MKTITVLLVLLLLAALVLAAPLAAQLSSRFDLRWSLLSGGGGSRASSNYAIDDVLGQWPDGQSLSTHYRLDPGLWPVGRESEANRLYVPLIRG